MLSFPHAKTYTSNRALALRRSFYLRAKRAANLVANAARIANSTGLTTDFPADPRPRPTKSDVRSLRAHSPSRGHFRSFRWRPKGSRQTDLRRAHREHNFHATTLEPRPGHLSTASPRPHSARGRTKTSFRDQQRPPV